ncbi:hypothetical protein GCM10010363_54570 [Streptomyces omiyaensis]|nr:hypothetical protein GCM10010363_54570 [Streptomyces omiyaensis]
MAAVRGGHADAVVVFSLCRLTRRGALEATRIIEELEAHGVRLVSVEEPYLDTSTSVGVGILAIIAGLAQQESDMKSAYVSATKDTLRRAGSHVSGVAPYGFTAERATSGELSVVRLVPDPAEAPHVRDMAEWAAEGVSASQIAKRLNERGVPTKAESLGESGAKRLASRRARSLGSSGAPRVGVVHRPAHPAGPAPCGVRDRVAGTGTGDQGRRRQPRPRQGGEARRPA